MEIKWNKKKEKEPYFKVVVSNNDPPDNFVAEIDADHAEVLFC